MKLLWATDLHFNFLPEGGARYIGEEFAQKGDAIVMTGDLSEADVLQRHLEEFVEGFKKPIYYVLGNHDAYRGSVRKGPFVVGAEWLTKMDQPIELSPSVGLVGDDGWWDCGEGNAYWSTVDMSDFYVIHDFMGLNRAEIIDKASKIGVVSAKTLEPKLRSAAALYSRVLVACHVPPWRGATWHEGQVSNSNWLPWFCHKEMGRMIEEVAGDFKDCQFEVLVGHTHSEGVYQAADNVVCYTGSAEYGDPQIYKEIEV